MCGWLATRGRAVHDRDAARSTRVARTGAPDDMARDDAARNKTVRNRAVRNEVACDDGAAVVDFVLISVLLIFLLFAVLQVAIYFYARNVAAASAAGAARYAATETTDPRSGAARADQLLRAGLDDRDARAIHCTSRPAVDAASGLAVTTVHCTGRIRLFFTPLGLPLTIDVTSSVLRERTPQ